MCQARLNHCILLHVLRERTDSLLDTDIAKKFTERNERHKTSLNIWLSFLAFISFCENNVNFFITAMHSHTKTFSVFQCLSFCLYDNSKCKYVCDTKLYITVPSWAMPPPPPQKNFYLPTTPSWLARRTLESPKAFFQAEKNVVQVSFKASLINGVGSTMMNLEV